MSHPAAFHYGPGHVVMYANPEFQAEFGSACLGQPAREVMVSLPPRAFEVMDLVLEGLPSRTKATSIPIITGIDIMLRMPVESAKSPKAAPELCVYRSRANPSITGT